jgi:phospholipase/lecithinase/hemolysin
LVAAPPYYGGRLANGPIWVERLAERLDLGHRTENNAVPAPSLAGGTNYAFGGAETGPGLSKACVPVNGVKSCAPNIGLQIETFFEDGRTLEGDELIVVQGGANNKSAQNAANELADHVATLAAAGGEFFLVPNLERLSQYPAGYDPDSHWDKFVAKFDAELQQQLDELEGNLNITIVRLNMLELSDAIINNPAAFGFLNVTDPACPGCGFGIPAPDAADTIVANPEEYLYWDTVHFTTAAHRIFGDAAANAVDAELRGNGLTEVAVPEQATLGICVFTVLTVSILHVRHRRFE